MTCTIASSTTLDVFGDFNFKNMEGNKGSPQLGYWVDIKKFCIASLAFFVMVRTNKDL
jgi:hypothetical protein